MTILENLINLIRAVKTNFFVNEAKTSFAIKARKGMFIPFLEQRLRIFVVFGLLISTLWLWTNDRTRRRVLDRSVRKCSLRRLKAAICS